jgi:hypothetical protein
MCTGEPSASQAESNKCSVGWFDSLHDLSLPPSLMAVRPMFEHDVHVELDCFEDWRWKPVISLRVGTFAR